MGANQELFERTLHAETSGDFEAMAALYAPDAVRISPVETG